MIKKEVTDGGPGNRDVIVMEERQQPVDNMPGPAVGLVLPYQIPLRVAVMLAGVKTPPEQLKIERDGENTSIETHMKSSLVDLRKRLFRVSVRMSSDEVKPHKGHESM